MSGLNRSDRMRKELIKAIIEERERHLNLPGSEFDLNNGPNDWVAIAGRYLTEGAQRKGVTPLSDDFIDNLTKAAAVILAGLEHVNHMKENKRLK